MLKKKNALALLAGALFIASILISGQIPQILQALTETTTNKPPDLVIPIATTSDIGTESLSIPSTNSDALPCAYLWATQPLPAESRRIEQMLKQAEFENVEVVAEAFGENCVTVEGKIVRFAAMQTDIRLFVRVKSLSNQMDLGNLTANVLEIILGIPLSTLPGTQSGYIGIQFTSEQEEVLNLWFKRDWAEQLLQSGVQGEELYRELQRK